MSWGVYVLYVDVEDGTVVRGGSVYDPVGIACLFVSILSYWNSSLDTYSLLYVRYIEYISYHIYAYHY